MSTIDVIRAWKDEDYRNSLSPEQREQLPTNPAGLVELNDGDLNGVEGGTDTGLSCVTAVTAISVAISVAVTELQSCSAACDRTMNAGTCRVRTRGCC
jgi:mersacidin/lichenicidin family type 2 lantibiotic